MNLDCECWDVHKNLDLDAYTCECECHKAKPRGGKRQGAGRKAQGLKRSQIMLTSEQRDKALALGNGNLSLGIRNALDTTNAWSKVLREANEIPSD